MANSGDKILYFLIGGFVGASVALLFAPKSGEETRNFLEGKYREGTEKLNQQVRKSKEQISESYQDLSGRVSQSVEKGRDVVNRQKEQLATAIEAGRRAYQEEKSQLEPEARDNEPTS